MTRPDTVFVTGATGLIAGEVLARLLRSSPEMRALVLVRDEARWHRAARRFGPLADRITPLRGDLTRRDLGLAYPARRQLTRDVTLMLHAGADTSFSSPLQRARLVNTEGTRGLLSLARVCGGLQRIAYVSTAFVAGRNRGLILERDNGIAAGWVNAYERSKYEAEALVRASPFDWVIFRPSTIVCQDISGSVTQINAVHRALRVYYRGLAAMMPGSPSDLLDVVTADYVCDAITRLMRDPRASGATLHLCAGKGALPLGELIGGAYELWASDPAWRKRGIERPVLADLETYELFASAVIETGDTRLAKVLSSLSYFIPQIALSKTFDTSVADALLGFSAPAARAFWAPMLRHLLKWNWAQEVAA